MIKISYVKDLGKGTIYRVCKLINRPGLTNVTNGVIGWIKSQQQEQQALMLAKQRLEQIKGRVEKLSAFLYELGIEPNHLN